MGGGLTAESVECRFDVAEKEDNGNNPDDETHFPVETGRAAKRSI